MPSIYHIHRGGSLEADVRVGQAWQNLWAYRLWPSELVLWQAEIEADLEINYRAIIIFDTVQNTDVNQNICHVKLDEAICV